MKKITCKKPCNIGGERFAIGDDVPEKLVAPGREATLIKYGLISVENVPDAPSAADGGNTPDGNADGLKQPTESQQEPAANPSDDDDQKPAKRVKK